MGNYTLDSCGQQSAKWHAANLENCFCWMLVFGDDDESHFYPMSILREQRQVQLQTWSSLIPPISTRFLSEDRPQLFNNWFISFTIINCLRGKWEYLKYITSNTSAGRCLLLYREKQTYKIKKSMYFCVFSKLQWTLLHCKFMSLGRILTVIRTHYNSRLLAILSFASFLSLSDAL